MGMRLIDADNVLKALGIFNDREHGDPHFLNGIETAREIVEQSQTIGSWISVNDRLPDRGADVLAFMRNGAETRIVACNYGNDVWYDCVMNCIVAFQNVTHWMPLPEPPKEVCNNEV